MKPRYVVFGGIVKSQEDGQLHVIRARQLCYLYGLDPEEHVLIDNHEDSYRTDISGLPVLTTRDDGDYSLQRLAFE